MIQYKMMLIDYLQAQSYTNYFADALVAEAKRDSRIIGIHAAMGGGTGMNRFEKASQFCHLFSGLKYCCVEFISIALIFM